nr:MAG TPA: hypothetical protein [Caudoviricetes sp.]
MAKFSGRYLIQIHAFLILSFCDLVYTIRIISLLKILTSIISKIF